VIPEVSALAFALLTPGMISDFNSIEGGLETKQRVPVRFVHAPRVKLTLEDGPTPPTAMVVARILWLRKQILPKVRYTSDTRPSPAR
jgi:hypothetical protein